MKTLAINPNAELISKYHSLLESEWTSQSTGTALALARRVLADAGCELLFHWEKQTQERESFAVGPETSEHLRDFMLSFYVEKTPETVPHLPTRRAKEAVQLSRFSEELSILLNFQYLAKTQFQIMVNDQTGLFKNCQSLLATLGIHFLLPELRCHRLRKEEQFATNAITLHIAQIWHDDLPHQAYLSGMLADYLGHEDLSRRALEFAFATTSPKEHDYLTTAHVLWYHYLDAGDDETAKEFVLSLYRSSPKEYLEEIEEMVSDTYAVCDA